MKKMKAMAVILAATMMIGGSGVSALAAQPAVSAAQIQEVQTVLLSDADVQSEIMAVANEAETTAQAFDWNNLQVGETAELSEQAYKVDLSGESMAKDSLAGGSTVTRTSTGYLFTIKGQTIEKYYLVGTFTAYPTKVTVTLYNSDEEEVPISATVSAVVDKKVDISFEIPEDYMGMKPESAAAGYANMIKVSMKTNQSDGTLGKLLPAMVSPTFFYAFNVGDAQ